MKLIIIWRAEMVSSINTMPAGWLAEEKKNPPTGSPIFGRVWGDHHQLGKMWNIHLLFLHTTVYDSDM
jgi:hypothetical protein